MSGKSELHAGALANDGHTQPEVSAKACRHSRERERSADQAVKRKPGQSGGDDCEYRKLPCISLELPGMIAAQKEQPLKFQETGLWLFRRAEGDFGLDA